MWDTLVQTTENLREITDDPETAECVEEETGLHGEELDKIRRLIDGVRKDRSGQ